VSAELFVELRCEELPARMVRPAVEGLKAWLLGLLEGVGHGRVSTWATPRRLAVAIEDVASGRPVVEREVTGPPAAAAFRDGQPTDVALGFARSRGVDPSALRIVELPKRGPVVAASIREGGEQAVDLVRTGLGAVIEKIPFPKAMVWGTGGLAFGRPLHGIVALYGGRVIEGEAHGIRFGDTTVGHRLAPEPLRVTGSADWLAGMRERWVEPDFDVRRARIAGLLDEAAAELEADPIRDDALLEEVTNLVEWPVKVIGDFDADLLGLPPRLLVTSMRVHQRYFPVHRQGALTSRFVVISNNPVGKAALIAEGNARVLRARFHDARFFLAEDRHEPLAEHGAKLVQMRWIRGLGTMSDKQRRVAELARELAAWTGADPELAAEAGSLCKADLATQMVGEFPELQGHMGRLYAEHEGRPAAVATAIEEHYQPRFADDAVAATEVGATVALADRLDTLVGCFGIGMEPTGGGDPQGLRRAALGVARTVLAHGLRGSLRRRFADAIATFDAYAEANPDGFEAWRKAAATRDPAALALALVEFTLARLKAQKVAEGVSPDVVDAVLAVSDHDPDLVVVDRKLAALVAITGTPDFPVILTTFKRVLNITAAAGGDIPPPAPSRATVAAELDLLARADRVSDEVEAAADRLDHGAALAAILGLRPAVEAFFDAVLVNADDADVRALRLGILVKVADVFRRVADFSRISTR
jgi:glycyl-tRNA synthetase beta chain